MDTLKNVRMRHIAALTLALSLAACGSDAKEPTAQPQDGSDDDGSSDDGSSADGSSTDGSADGTPADGGDGTPTEVELPYVVDNNYVPAGFMGAAESITALPSLTDDDITCKGNRPSGSPVGNCHTFTYVLDPAAIDQWAGVFWQYGEGNWTGPGLKIAPGAKEIHFQARADSPVTLKFAAGMEKDGATGLPVDGWNVESDPQTITTEWKVYSIDISNKDYDDVTGAFAWVIDNMQQGTNEGPFKFYIDDIQWK